MLLYLAPFRFFQENNIDNIKLPSRQVLDVFSDIIIVLSLYSIIYFFGTVRNIFQMDLGDARNSLYAGTVYVESGIFNTIASVSASFYVFAQLLFFVYKSIGGSSIRCNLLLISSISEPIHILSYVGRDGIVFWLFSFAMLYAFFRNFLSKDTNKQIKKIFIVVGVLLIIPFLLITIGRFTDSDSGSMDSIFSYMGMGMVQGTLFFGMENPPMSQGQSFPLFCEILNIDPGISGGMREIGEWRSWGFSTFIVTFYSTFGFWGMYFVGIILLLFFHISMRYNSKTLMFHLFFIYILYFQVIGQGVFYFRHYTRGGNLFILLCPIFMLLFMNMYNKRSIILKKK